MITRKGANASNVATMSAIAPTRRCGSVVVPWLHDQAQIRHRLGALVRLSRLRALDREHRIGAVPSSASAPSVPCSASVRRSRCCPSHPGASMGALMSSRSRWAIMSNAATRAIMRSGPTFLSQVVVVELRTVSRRDRQGVVELARSEGEEALLVLSSTALSDEQRRSILAGFRAPWDTASWNANGPPPPKRERPATSMLWCVTPRSTARTRTGADAARRGGAPSRACSRSRSR